MWVQQADSYQLSDEDDPVTPEQSQHFIFARLDIEFVEQGGESIDTSDFNLVSGDSTYRIIGEYGDQFEQPIQADTLQRTIDGPEGSSTSGYVVYSVPQDVTPSNAAIAWSADTPWARWQQG